MVSSVAYIQLSLPQVYWNNEENTEFIWDRSKISLELFQKFGQELLCCYAADIFSAEI